MLQSRAAEHQLCTLPCRDDLQPFHQLVFQPSGPDMLTQSIVMLQADCTNALLQARRVITGCVPVAVS